MRLRLVNAGSSPLNEFRLALTSVVQLTPVEDAPTRLVTRTSGYHELAPPEGFELRRARLGRRCADVRSPARHANDGPASAFVILADGSTRPVHVGATALADPVGSDGRRRRAGARFGHRCRPAGMGGRGGLRTTPVP